MDINKLDSKARQVAKEYKKMEQQLLSLVIQIDKGKIFYKLGFSSLFKYLTEGLELSPATACAFTNVARKAQEVPELKSQVVSGKLSIYKAQRITSILTPQNSETWLKLAANKTHRELEREVAIASPQNAIKEKSRYVPLQQEQIEKVIIKRDIPRMELQLGVSEKLMLKIRRAQDLESQRNKKNMNLEQTLEEVLAVYLEKRDPLKKAQRQSVKEKLRKEEQKQTDTIILKIQEQKKNTKRKGQKEKQRQSAETKFKTVGNQRRRSIDNNCARAKEKLQKQEQNQRKKELLRKEEQRPSTLGELQPAQNKKCRSIDKYHARAKANKREIIPAQLRHQLQIRDKSQCAHTDSQGRRCSARRFLEAHHIKPVSQGGENSLKNLTLLCSGHHKSVHS